MPRKSNSNLDELSESLEGPSLMFEELDGLLGYRLRRAQGAMHRDFLGRQQSLVEQADRRSLRGAFHAFMYT